MIKFIKAFKAFKTFIIECYQNDPVKKCPVYLHKGCSHVDGLLCDYPDCSIVEEFKNGKMEK